MQSIIDFYNAHSAVIFAVLFFISEALALIPSVKANSIFQVIFNFLQKKQAPPAA
jgi:hypothetical protein